MALVHSGLPHAVHADLRIKESRGEVGRSALNERTGFVSAADGRGDLQRCANMDTDPVSINSVVLHEAISDSHGDATSSKKGNRPETPARFSRFVAAPHLAAKLRGKKISLPPLRKAGGDSTTTGSSSSGSSRYVSNSVGGLGEGAPSQSFARLASREDARSGTRSPLSRLLRVGRHDPGTASKVAGAGDGDRQVLPPSRDALPLLPPRPRLGVFRVKSRNNSPESKHARAAPSQVSSSQLQRSKPALAPAAADPRTRPSLIPRPPPPRMPLPAQAPLTGAGAAAAPSRRLAPAQGALPPLGALRTRSTAVLPRAREPQWAPAAEAARGVLLPDIADPSLFSKANAFQRRSGSAVSQPKARSSLAQLAPRPVQPLAAAPSLPHALAPSAAAFAPTCPPAQQTTIARPSAPSEPPAAAAAQSAVAEELELLSKAGRVAGRMRRRPSALLDLSEFDGHTAVLLGAPAQQQAQSRSKAQAKPETKQEAKVQLKQEAEPETKEEQQPQPQRQRQAQHETEQLQQAKRQQQATSQRQQAPQPAVQPLQDGDGGVGESGALRHGKMTAPPPSQTRQGSFSLDDRPLPPPPSQPTRRPSVSLDDRPLPLPRAPPQPEPASSEIWPKPPLQLPLPPPPPQPQPIASEARHAPPATSASTAVSSAERGAAAAALPPLMQQGAAGTSFAAVEREEGAFAPLKQHQEHASADDRPLPPPRPECASAHAAEARGAVPPRAGAPPYARTLALLPDSARSC